MYDTHIQGDEERAQAEAEATGLPLVIILPTECVTDDQWLELTQQTEG